MIHHSPSLMPLCRSAIRAAMLIALAGSLFALPTGCSSSSDSASTDSGRTLTQGEFVRTEPDPAKPTAVSADDQSSATPATTTVGTRSADRGFLSIGDASAPATTIITRPAPSQRSESINNSNTSARSSTTTRGPLQTTVGAPPPVAAKAGAKGEPIVVESLVGQINGKPVMASDILEPLDGVLRASAEKAKDLPTWRREAAAAIVGELKRRIEDELVLAEARRTLSPEQRQGLFKFLEQVQGAMVSQQRGSAVAANELSETQSGRTLREEAQDRVDQELIRNELRQRVLPRVVVSWRDVQLEYERQADKFNPPAEYTFRMVYVSGIQNEAAAKLQALVSSGTSFAEIARNELNEFNRRESGRIVRSFSGPQTEGTFSPIPDLNTVMQQLAVGQIRGPIEYTPDKDRPERKRTAFVYLEQIDQPEGVSLYDAQLQVENSLREERTGSEIGRYFERLRNRGNVSRVEVMAEQLMDIAVDRYGRKFTKK